MVKVCHMTSAHEPEDERIFYKECVSLVQAGYETYLVAKGNSYEKNGVHIIGIGEVSGGRLHRMTIVSRDIYNKALSIDADIYHLHDPELLPFGIKLKNKGKKVIFDSHENIAESILEKTWIPVYLRKIVFRIYSFYENKILKKYDAVIFVSPNNESYFKQCNVNSTMITNYPVFKNIDIINNTFIGGISEKDTVVFAGGISEQWNHHKIIKAIEKIPYCSYNLYGSGSDEYLKKLKVLAGWKQVNYMGKIPHDKVVEALAKNTIGLSLLSPGYNTSGNIGTMGNTKIFEEMLAGIPIICTNFVLWEEFVDRYNCGICINPESEEEIINAIRYLLDNPQKAGEMGRNGQRAVQEEFNWETQAKKLVSLYETVLSD